MSPSENRLCTNDSSPRCSSISAAPRIIWIPPCVSVSVSIAYRTSAFASISSPALVRRYLVANSKIDYVNQDLEYKCNLQAMLWQYVQHLRIPCVPIDHKTATWNYDRKLLFISSRKSYKSQKRLSWELWKDCKLYRLQSRLCLSESWVYTPVFRRSNGRLSVVRTALLYNNMWGFTRVMWLCGPYTWMKFVHFELIKMSS